jgi:uncharacterized protein (TIGR03083 family)
MSGTTSIEAVAVLARPEATAVAAAETAAMADMLRSLSDAEWAAPTDCPAWDVRAMAGHVLGMTETFSSLRHFAPDMVRATRLAGDGPFIDGLTALQVRERARLTFAALIDRLERAGPRQARWRGSRRLMRRIPIKQPMRDGHVETWRAGFLFDIVLTRDTWMHRVDIARATGREIVLVPGHDDVIVADVVAEWARRHGQPFTLHLTGPAGGSFRQGEGGEELTLDAVEWCRILSGRASGTGLLNQEVPF